MIQSSAYVAPYDIETFETARSHKTGIVGGRSRNRILSADSNSIQEQSAGKQCSRSCNIVKRVAKRRAMSNCSRLSSKSWTFNKKWPASQRDVTA